MPLDPTVVVALLVWVGFWTVLEVALLLLMKHRN